MMKQLQHRPFTASRSQYGPAAAQLRSHRSVRTRAVTTSTAAVGEVLKWAKGQSISADKLQTSTDLASEQEVLVVDKDVGAGETLITVPEGAWISAETVKNSSIGTSVSELEQWLQISLYLVQQRFGSGSSSSNTYIGLLPGTSDSPLFWTDEQLSLLQGSQILQSVIAYKQFFQTRYEDLQQGLFAQQPALFPADVFTFDNFLWAVATVRSRAHAPLEADKIALVPLADSIPHSRSGNTSWKVKAGGLFSRAQNLAVESTRSLRRGEALSLDYGPGKSDSSVLLDYGVMDLDAARGGYRLTLNISEEDRNLDDKLDILEQEGLSSSIEFVLTADQAPSANMLGFLRLMQLNGMDAFLLESIFRNEVWGHMEFPVSEENEAMLCKAMVDGAADALAGYPTSIDQDLATLRTGELAKGSREEIAVRVVLGEKEALDATMAWFEARCSQLKALEYYQERRLKRLKLLDDEGRSTYNDFFKDGIA